MSLTFSKWGDFRPLGVVGLLSLQLTEKTLRSHDLRSFFPGVAGIGSATSGVFFTYHTPSGHKGGNYRER